MIVPQGVTLILDEAVSIWLVLLKNEKNIEYMNFEGKIVRIPKPEDPIQIGSVKFNDLSMKQEQQLTQYCFHVQRQRIREKKL